MEQMKKTALKRQLWEQEKYCLVVDSLQNAEINCEFEAVQNNLFQHLRGFDFPRQISRIEHPIIDRTESLFNRLFEQDKINLGTGGFY